MIHTLYRDLLVTESEEPLSTLYTTRTAELFGTNPPPSHSMRMDPAAERPDPQGHPLLADDGYRRQHSSTMHRRRGGTADGGQRAEDPPGDDPDSSDRMIKKYQKRVPSRLVGCLMVYVVFLSGLVGLLLFTRVHVKDSVTRQGPRENNGNIAAPDEKASIGKGGVGRSVNAAPSDADGASTVPDGAGPAVSEEKSKTVVPPIITREDHIVSRGGGLVPVRTIEAEQSRAVLDKAAYPLLRDKNATAYQKRFNSTVERWVMGLHGCGEPQLHEFPANGTNFFAVWTSGGHEVRASAWSAADGGGRTYLEAHMFVPPQIETGKEKDAASLKGDFAAFHSWWPEAYGQ